MGFLNSLFGSSNTQVNSANAKNHMNSRNAKNKVVNIKPMNVKPMNTRPVNNKTTQLVLPQQQGGMAPVNFQYPPRMQQPSQAVMEWATTAGAPMPPASEMRNVAHGGKRRTMKHSRRSHRKTHMKKRHHKKTAKK
jgi:hypothetical protein